MNKKRNYELSEEEYEIICFYRRLPSKKKEKFKELLSSLEKLLIIQKESD